MSFKNLNKYLIPILLIVIIVPTLFIPTISDITNIEFNSYETNEKFDISHSGFCWPIPGYTRISSPFGKRTSPTAGASSYHQGIDIPAPAGTNLVSPYDSKVSFIGFKGSGRIHNNFKKPKFTIHLSSLFP